MVRTPESGAPDEPTTNYTIDDLAAQSGVPSRTIRYYQSEGALPPPERRGRVALYDDDHLQRLKLISELQTRGLSLGLIRDLVQRTAPGNLSVVEWLGLTDRLAVPWSDDRPADLTDSELRNHLGKSAFELLDRLEEAGIVVRRGERRYHVPSPALLDMMRELDAAGIDPDTSFEAAATIRRHLAAGIDEVVGLLMGRAGHGFGRELDPVSLTRAIDAFRPIATRAVMLIFEQEVERSLRSAGWPPS
jgi:DNA-binding transcriptional MerR regulator